MNVMYKEWGKATGAWSWTITSTYSEVKNPWIYIFSLIRLNGLVLTQVQDASSWRGT